jgi:hypothetical protein
MKTVFGALALVIAAPVAAQEAPAPDAHADHSRHQQQPQQTEQQHEGHPSEEHKMDCCKDCRDEADGKMACCAKHGEAPEGAADHSQHAN